MTDQEILRLRKSEAPAAMGVSTTALYKRIEKYKWRQEVDEDNKAWVWIPKRFITNPLYVKTPPADSELNLGIKQDLNLLNEQVEQVKSQYELRLKDKDALIDSLKSQLETQKEQISMLNNQVQNANTQIQKYRSEPYHELLTAVTDLKTELNRKKSWWPFSR